MTNDGATILKANPATKETRGTPTEPRAEAAAANVDEKMNAAKRKRGQDSDSAFNNSGLQSILPQSLPWNDNEIRLVGASPLTPQEVLSETSWLRIYNDILQSHKNFIKQVRSAKQPVTPYFIKRMHYCQAKMCGVIEVAPQGDVARFRNEVIPFLDLPIKIKALLKSDMMPVVKTFASQTYEVYSSEDYIEFLKMVHPTIKNEPFKVIRTIMKGSGRQFFIRTSQTVVEYIRAKGFKLQHVVGYTIFEQHIEFVEVEQVFSSTFSNYYLKTFIANNMKF